MAVAIDSFEKKSVSIENSNIIDKLKILNEGFESSVESNEGVFCSENFENQAKGLIGWLGTEEAAISKIPMESLASNIKQMYNGIQLENGNQTLGLKKIGTYKINNYSDLRSNAGYAAEVISTAKENIINEYNGKEIKTFRTDDLPKLFEKNDQYVDKVRMDSNGKIIERIQTKFIGKNGSECVTKLMTEKSYEKYLTDGKVDKIEIPKDFYKDAKKEIVKRREGLNKQIDNAAKVNNVELKENLEAKVTKLNTIDEMLEQSNTTLKESIQATKHPKMYSAKLLAKRSAMDGINQAKWAMVVTGAISTIDNAQKVMNGTLSVEDAVVNVCKDTGTAGVAAFGIGFVSSGVSGLMQSSGNELIKSIGKAGGGCLPAAAVVYGITVKDTVIDYAKGEIDTFEFADGMAEAAFTVAGGFIGGGLGSTLGPVGTIGGSMAGSKVGEITYDTGKLVVGTTVDLATGEITVSDVASNVADGTEEVLAATSELASSAVGYVVATEAYATAVDMAEDAIEGSAEAVEKIGDKAKKCAKDVTDNAAKLGDDVAKDVKTAMASYNKKFNLPF